MSIICATMWGMTKDKMISLRISADLLARIDRAAKAEAEQIGYPISRNAWIEATLDGECAEVEARLGID